MREVSSVFITWFVIFTLLLIHAVREGTKPYYDFMIWCRQPVVLILNVISLFFVVFHSITWFQLAPKAMVVRLGGKRVPGFWLAASNYALWALASALVAWLILSR
jgi:fumarate reductase subunit C